MKLNRRLILLIICAIIIGVTPIDKISANSDSFSVHRLTYDASSKKVIESKSLFTTSDFNKAKDRMLSESKKQENVVVKYNNSKSPMKYVATDKGMVQSYPYRDGVTLGKKTLDINRSPNLDSGSTYIEAHYKMYLEDTVKSNKGIVHKVSFQGIEGWYVENNKVDIIPHIYIENQATITLGGNEQYYDRETNFEPDKPYNIRPKYDYYVVNRDSEMLIEAQWTFSGEYRVVGPYAKVPNWLKPGRYFSKDGITFYQDFEFKNPVKNNNGEIGEFYPYYVWLPLRSRSNYTGIELNNHNSKNSVYYNKENLFVEYGEKYGINPLINYAQATHESAYGTSPLAKNKNNLYGWGAFDSNPNDAQLYASVEQSIREHSGMNLRRYLTPTFSFHYGTSLGNKGSGITMKYASDPFYGEKVAKYAYEIDKENGFKDYNAYELFKLSDKTPVPFSKNPNSSPFYKMEDMLINQIVTGFEKSNNNLLVNSHVPFDVILDSSTNNLDISMRYIYSDVTKEKLYVKDKFTYNLDSGGPKGDISQPRVFITDTVEQFVVNTNGLRLRQSWNTDSKELTSLSKGTKVKGQQGNNGWTKVYYKDYIGYVSSDHISKQGSTEVIPPEVEKPDIEFEVPSDDKFTSFVVDSKNYDSLVVRKGPSINTDNIGTLAKNAIVTAAKYNENWHIIKYGKGYGFVSSQFLKPSQEESQISRVKGDANGDFIVNISDLMSVKEHLQSKIIISDKYIENVQLTEKGKVTISDLMKLKGYLQGKNGL